MSGEPSPEERIISAAIECIERVGIQGTTIRKIAEIAGVNSAAINYYFRTKDAVLERVLATSTENAFGDWERLIVDSALAPRDRLRPILVEALEGIYNFPNLVRAQLHGPVVEGDFDTTFARRYRSFMVLARSSLAASLPAEKVPSLDTELVALFAATMGMAVLGGLYMELPLGLDTPEGRAKYVDFLLDRFLGGSR